MVTPEQRIKKEIKDFIERKGGYWSVVTGGAYSKPGDPDLICFFPNDGRFIGIEAKTPSGRQSDVQKCREKEIVSKGGIYLLTHSVTELVQQLESHGVPLAPDTSRSPLSRAGVMSR